MHFQPNPITKTRENGHKPSKMSKWPLKRQFSGFGSHFKGENEYLRTWYQYKKCRHWSKPAFCAFSAKSNHKNWRKWPKTFKNGHFWGFGRNNALFWPLPVSGNKILFYINLITNQGNNLQKTAYKNFFLFSQNKKTYISSLYF